MCYVIVTFRSMLWTLMTLTSTLAVVAALISPYWLIGKTKTWTLSPYANENKTDYETVQDKSQTYQPTIGLYNRCTKLHRATSADDNCATYITGYGMPHDSFPDPWKAALFMFGVATALLTFTVVTSVLSLCVRAICKKSIFTVSGLVQSVAGLFLIIGLVLYPAGWGSDRIGKLCGNEAGPYSMDDCSFGWAFFVMIGGTVGAFLCSVVSIQAENSTSSDKVEAEILDGKNLICIL